MHTMTAHEQSDSSNTKRESSLGKRIVGLDELRGIAVLTVMLGHGGGIAQLQKYTNGLGHHGVVLFFFISGFIITKILLLEKERHTGQTLGTFDYFSKFYIRRIFRILPLYYILLLVSALLFPQTAKYFVYSVPFLQNYTWAATDQIMLRTDITWSLAVEEHFYVFFPLVVLAVHRRFLPVVLVLASIVGVLFYTRTLPIEPFNAHYKFITHANLQYIAMGALLACGNIGRTLSIVSMLVWLSHTAYLDIYLGKELGKQGIDRHLVDFASLLAVFLATIGRMDFLRHAKPLNYLGVRCYGLYLIHFTIITLVVQNLGRGLPQYFLYIAISIVLAALSFRFIEEPIQNLRVHFEGNKSLSKALFATILFIFAACIALSFRIL